MGALADEGDFLRRSIQKMVLSSLLMMLALSLTVTTSFILAAQLFGHNAMAAINLVTPLLYFVCFLSSIIGTGTSYLYSFEIGAFRQEKANKLVGQGAILAVTSSILLAVILFFGREVFFSLFDVTDEIGTFACEYYSVFFLSAAINPIYFLMYVIVYADGGGKIGVIATFLSLLVTVVAGIIFGIKFGISGIALGTLLGYLTSIAVFSKWIFFDLETLKPILNISLSEIFRVMKYSLVRASLYLYIGLGNMILNTFFLKTFGEQNFPILSVVISILQFAVFLNGVAEAAEPLVNIYLGEKNFDGIKKVMKIAIKAALLSGAAIIPIFLLLGEEIAGLFNIGDEILAETVFAIRTIGFSMPFISLIYMFSTYYQICGHMKIAFALSFFKDFGFYLLIPIKRGVDSKLVMRISLIIEEIGMGIVDNNPNDEPLVELTLIFGEQTQIIIRDNGKHFDLTDETVNSFRSFFIYSFLEGSGTMRSYLTTQNYNRHIFTF